MHRLLCCFQLAVTSAMSSKAVESQTFAAPVPNTSLKRTRSCLVFQVTSWKRTAVPGGRAHMRWFLEQQPAICTALLSPQERRAESDICTLSDADVTNAEDVMKALKPMKDATALMLEESSPTISLIAPLHAKLLDDTKDSTGGPAVVKEIKQVIHSDLSKRYMSELEKNTHSTAAALDPRFKGRHFISE